MPESKEKLVQETGNEKRETRIEQKIEQSTGIKDVEARVHVPEEVKTWLQKIEQDPTQMKTVTDDQGQVVMQPTQTNDPRITIPTTRQNFVNGFKKTVGDAGRWLSTFVLRLIKIKKGKVKFEEK